MKYKRIKKSLVWWDHSAVELESWIVDSCHPCGLWWCQIGCSIENLLNCSFLVIKLQSRGRPSLTWVLTFGPEKDILKQVNTRSSGVWTESEPVLWQSREQVWVTELGGTVQSGKAFLRRWLVSLGFQEEQCTWQAQDGSLAEAIDDMTIVKLEQTYLQYHQVGIVASPSDACITPISFREISQLLAP